jgi:hypothetical protein
MHNDPSRPFDARIAAKGDRFRVVLIGGSTAALIDSGVIQHALRPLIQGDVEVINLARGGYISSQERIALVLYGIRLNPDVLVSLDGANDIVGMTKVSTPGIPYVNDAIALAVNHPVLNAFASILRYSQFVNALLKLKERRVERNVQTDVARTARTLEYYKESLAAISTIAKGLNIPHVMVLQPYLYLRPGMTDRERDLPDTRNYAYRTAFMVSMFGKMDSTLANTRFADNTTYVNGNRAFDASSGEIFDDEVHLTENGKQRLMQYVFSTVRESMLSAGSKRFRAAAVR